VAGYDVFRESLQVRQRIGYLPESVPLYVDMRVAPYLDFVAEVKAKTGEPWPTQHFVTTYGDMLIFKAALEAAGKADRKAVAQALRTMNLSGGAASFFPGTGKLRFEENGRRADASLLIVQWQKGVPITVYPPKDASPALSGRSSSTSSPAFSPERRRCAARALGHSPSPPEFGGEGRGEVGFSVAEF